MTVNIFEQASRQNLGFHTSRGILSVHDLWNLPLTSKGDLSLDSIGIKLKKELRETEEESLVNVSSRSSSNALLQLRFDIVKHIIDVIQKERQENINKEAVASKKRALQEILESKKLQAQQDKTIEELEAEISALG